MIFGLSENIIRKTSIEALSDESQRSDPIGQNVAGILMSSSRETSMIIAQYCLTGNMNVDSGTQLRRLLTASTGLRSLRLLKKL